MALLSYDMIEQIRGVADAYERTERKRLASVSAADSDQQPKPANRRRSRGGGSRD